MTFCPYMLAPHRSRILVYLAAGLACIPGFGWAQADALKHDPFARPVFSKPTPPPGARPRESAGVGVGTAPEPAWRPELAAVMLAGPRSVVSIDGTIVRIGDEINGHRLVEVHERTAVFVKNRKRVTLSLRGTERAPEAAPPTRNAPPKPDDRGTAEGRDERKPEQK